ncbi:MULTISPECIES: hypothetical protein [Halorussus]|uniref:hypothetical protein n=1 Tax=Halorussus TaxID=1070314 RepID=UPI000E20ED8A|nr:MULTISPECIES: hypothetical protein [Halorussus]NHN61358.1 hypothetical protein [Halorussus sp. JP-T4]
MTDPDHPFSRDRIAAVADERGVGDADLEDALAGVQSAVARGEGEYEYSSEHNFGWRDDEAYYLNGDGIWRTLADQLSLDEELAGAAREVHRRRMTESADERGEADAVAEMFADGAEPLVVVDTASDPPLYGQDV